MQFDILKNLFQSVINSIQNTGVSAVKTLKDNTFKVSVINPVKKVEVEGSVVVKNQSYLESKVLKIDESIKELDKSVKNEAKLERTVKVSGLEKMSSKSNQLTSEITKAIKEIKIPKSFEVSNQIDNTSSIKEMIGKVSDVEQAVKRLKLDPQIHIEAPKPVIVPPSSVTVEKTEIDYQKLSEAITKKLPEGIDYKKLSSVLSKEMSSIVISGGSVKSSSSFSNNAGLKIPALLDDDRHVQVDVLTMPSVTIPPVTIPPVTIDTTGLAIESKQQFDALTDAQLRAAPVPVLASIDTTGLALESKQLPNNHQVTVSNQPTEFPLPSAQVATLTPPAAITGFATSAKQDTLLNELKLKANLTDTQPVSLAVAPITPVTGTFWQATQPISGTVTANTGLTQPLTDTQLRANPVPISGTVAATNAGITTIAGAVSGNKMQVDVITMPTVNVNTHAVTATDLDIRNLTNTDVVTAELSAVDNAVLDNIDTSTAATSTVLGSKTDAKSTATDSTSVSAMQVLKQISASLQSPPSQPVTFTGSTDVATQTTLALIKAKTDNIPPLGQALNTASVPVVLTAAQMATLTPVTAVTVTNATAANLKAEVTGATSGSGTSTGALRVELPTNGTGVVGLNAGTNAIGKLTSNSGVTIGAVEIAASQTLSTVTTVGAVTAITNALPTGTNAIGNVGIIPRTTGGLIPYHLVSAGSTNATVVKASAGQLFGWFIYNSNAAARKLVFHNTASTPTAGSSVYFSIVIPPNSGANVFSDIGIAFSAGIAITTVTGLADSDAVAVAANDLIINLWYT
jgi:hypothetical protein